LYVKPVRKAALEYAAEEVAGCVGLAFGEAAGAFEGEVAGADGALDLCSEFFG
jgi:hypothetical protein